MRRGQLLDGVVNDPPTCQRRVPGETQRGLGSVRPEVELCEPRVEEQIRRNRDLTEVAGEPVLGGVAVADATVVDQPLIDRTNRIIAERVSQREIAGFGQWTRYRLR